MSTVDTRKAGNGQTVSFADVRFESCVLLPEQLVALIEDGLRDAQVDVHIDASGTGQAR